MEDEGSSQRRHEDSKSIFSYLSDGMENAKKVMDIAEPFVNFRSFDAKINRLKRKSDLLKGREEDVSKELEYAESLSLKRRRSEVETWLNHVGQLKVKVHRAEQEAQERKRRLLPDFRFPEKLDRLTIEVDELYRQGVFPHGITLEALESQGVIFPTTKSIGQTFEDNKNMILESLRDNNVISTGIYGMGGVGKTTVLTHVNNELVRSFPGTSVVWVTVSQKFAIHKLQDDIARKLRFSFTCNEDERIRAAELWKFLGRKKNLVLILDDVWEDIPLQEVGIPVCENGCKLILTTRFFDVCRRMNCQKIVKVTPLSKEESWELFRDKLGDDLEITPQIEEIAKALVRECDGLPLGIITMARSMKGADDFFEWRNALEKMRGSNPGYDDMESKVFQVLKKSYDMLKDPIVQQCFLDCALYPEDFVIKREHLINLFIDEGLIDGMKSRQAEFDRGHTILNKLVNSCLLETCERQYVKMHDLVRDMALQITSEKPRFLVEAGRGLMSVPDEDVWKEDLAKVSLMYNSISKFPLNFESPKCPNLSTLLMNNNFELRHINNNFFLHMKGLVLLDLSRTSIENLPDSISELVNLSLLLLQRCKRLKFIPSLAKLRALKKLDLEGSGAILVHHGIGDLVKLRYLRCKFDGVDSFNTYTAFLQERGGPTYYQLRVGRHSHYELFETDRDIRLSDFGSSFPYLLPKCVEGLFIEGSTIEVGSLCDVVPFRNIINLRVCEIATNYGTKHLFDNSTNSANPLQTIEVLCLWGMVDLLALNIWSPDPSTSFPYVTFSSLKTLYLFYCESIQRVFTNSHLPNIETIRIMGCNSLVEIISNCGEGADDIPTSVSLPKLLELTLSGLKSLQSVAVISDSIQTVTIKKCPKLKRIPLLDREEIPASLQKVDMDDEVLGSLEWSNPNAKDVIHSLVRQPDDEHL